MIVKNPPVPVLPDSIQVQEGFFGQKTIKHAVFVKYYYVVFNTI